MTITISHPQPGDYVAVEECEFICGNSGVPFTVPVAEHRGTLAKMDDTTYTLTDDGTTIATITSVYEAEEDGWKQPRLLISGWKKYDGRLTRIRWVITK